MRKEAINGYRNSIVHLLTHWCHVLHIKTENTHIITSENQTINLTATYSPSSQTFCADTTNH